MGKEGFMRHLNMFGYAIGLVAAAAVALPAVAQATVIGPGTGISTNTLDSGGTRTNIDLYDAANLAPGQYTATTFSFAAGAVGDVQPFLAILSSGTAGTSTAIYQVIALGNDNNIASSAGYGIHTVAFGGSDTFSISGSGAEVFAGFTGTTGNNPVPLDDGTGADAHNSPAFPSSDFVVGQNLPAFGYSDLPREYAFSINVATPEPSTVAMLGVAGAGLSLRRRRQA
jgi:hypothetical protein